MESEEGGWRLFRHGSPSSGGMPSGWDARFWSKNSQIVAIAANGLTSVSPFPLMVAVSNPVAPIFSVLGPKK